MNGKRFGNPITLKTRKDEEIEKKWYSKEKELSTDTDLNTLLGK